MGSVWITHHTACQSKNQIGDVDVISVGSFSLCREVRGQIQSSTLQPAEVQFLAQRHFSSVEATNNWFESEGKTLQTPGLHAAFLKSVIFLFLSASASSFSFC